MCDSHFRHTLMSQSLDSIALAISNPIPQNKPCNRTDNP